MATVGFSGLGAVSRFTLDKLKNVGRGTPPWDDNFPDGKRRTYTASHALRLVLVEALMEQGVTVSAAAEAVNFHGATIERFLDFVEAGHLPPALFVGYLRRQVDGPTGLSWESRSMGLSTAEEIVGAVSDWIGAVGSIKGKRVRERVVSGPQLAIASIGECYRRLEERAKAAGYSINGRGIFRAVADAAES